MQRSSWHLSVIFCSLFLYFVEISPFSLQAQPPTPLSGFPQANDIIRTFAQDATYTYFGGNFTAVGTPANPLLYTNLAKCTTTNSLPDPNVSAPQGTVKAIVPDGSGGFYVGGQFNSVTPGPGRNRIFHLLANGTVDAAWSAGSISSDVFSLAFDGTNLYVGGVFTTIGGQLRNRLAKLSGATGAVDLTWNPNVSGNVNTIAANGTDVYIGGSFTTVGGQTRNNVAKIDATTGAVDMAWNPNVSATVESLALYSGQIYMGGSFTHVTGTLRSSIARVDAATGVLDAVWDPGANAIVYSIVPTAAGVYVGGNFGIAGNQVRKKIARVSATGLGAADLTWDPGADPVSDMISSVFVISAVGTDVYVGGNFQHMGGQFITNCAKLDATTGNADATWQPNRESQVEDFAIDGAGNMLIGGGTGSGSVGGYNATGVARFVKATKALDLTWKPFIRSPVVRSLMLSGTDIFVGGFYNRINNTLINNIAKISTMTAALDLGWNPLGANSDVNGIVTDGLNIFVGGNFSGIGGQVRGKIAKLLLANPGTVDATWNPGANNLINSVKYDGAGNVYFGGDFTTIGGQSRGRIAKLSTSGAGAVDAMWNPNANNTVTEILISGTDVYAAGAFNSIGGQTRNRVAKLSASGTGAADVVWNPNATGNVYALAQYGTDIYIGGNFAMVSGQSRSKLAKVSATTGALDMMWNPIANGDVNEFAIDAANQWLFCGGIFTTMNSGAIANRSLSVLPVTAAPAFTYYYESGDPALPGSWGTQAGAGLGTVALNFNNSGDLFIIESGSVTASAAIPLPLAANVTVQIDGKLVMGNQPITGAGNLQLNALGTLSTSRSDGINGTSAPTGTVQLTGAITYNPTASFEFNAASGNIATNVAANGVKPAIAQMGNLTTLGINTTTLDAGVTVNGALTLNAGTFSTAAQTPTLGASATASVMNTARLRIGGMGTLLNSNPAATSLTIQSGGTLEINNDGQISPASASAVQYLTNSTLEYSGTTFKTINSKEIGAGGVQQLLIANTGGVQAGASITAHQSLNVSNLCTFYLDNIGNPTLTVNGAFTLNASGNLASANGANSGSLSLGGTGAITLRMALGNETLQNFTLNRSGTHSILTDLNVLGTLNLTSGALLPSTRVFSGDPAGTLVGTVPSGGTGYVQGKLQRRLAANIVSNGTNYFFPIGTPAGNRALTLVDAQTGASSVIEAEVFDAGASAVDATITRFFTSRNWHVQTVSGAFTSAALTLTESGLSGSNVVGRAPAQAGTYTNIGANSIGTSITSNPVTVPPGVNHYFAIGVISPAITNVAPLNVMSGDTITILGANLAGVLAVGIGGTPAASFVILSPTRIRAVVGGGSSGIVSVVSASGVASSAQSVVYSSAPLVSSFVPSYGTTGSTITIRGAQFTDVLRVSIGGVPAQSFTVQDPSTIQAVVDNGQTGTIAVQSLGGTGVSTGQFTFYRRPSIANFSPKWGKPGDTVRIVGAELGTTALVRFGSIVLTSNFTIVSSGQVNAIVPASGETGRISLENIVGADTSREAFTWTGMPTVTRATPLGSISTGTPITIEGTQFHPVPLVRIGSQTAASVVWNSLTSIVATFDRSTTGVLTVEASGGTVSLAASFSVIPPPSVVSLSPQNPSPGDLVTVTGANFLAGSTTIVIGGVPVSVRVLSSTQLTFTVPTAFFGGLSIGTLGGMPQATAASFRILPPPSITAVNGTTAVVGRVMTVNGMNFRNMVDVSVGGVSASFTALDSTGERLSVVVPTMPGLDSTAAELTMLEATIAVQTRSGLATYQHFFSNRPISTSAATTTTTTSLVMRISGISPLILTEGSSVVLQGTNIPSTAVVLLNGTLLTTATVQSSTMITCPISLGFVPFPLLSTTAQFSVSTTALTSTQGAFSLVPAPSLVRVEASDSPRLLGFQPASGNVETVINIIGQNFDTTASAEQRNSRPKRGTVRSISIGGLPVASWRVLSPTLLSATVGLVRTGVVRIETASGALVSQDVFLFDTTGQAAARAAALLGPVALKDSLALNRLYASSNGDSWTISKNANAINGGGAKWVSTVPVALRYGVKVESRRVVELRLPNIGLKGVIPPDVLRDLDSIRVLDLSGNALTGSIPQEIANDIHLERLRLGGNALGGRIPSGLCALTRLKELDVAGNVLEDSIGAIQCLSGLEVLNLRGNRFTGRFTPRLMEAFSELTVLDVSGNRLTGAIPDEIGLLSRLQRLHLRGNRFTGSFPVALGRTTSTAKTAKTSSSLGLVLLDIGENNFSGAVPDDIGNLVNLSELSIDHNALTGAVPSSVLRLTKLKKLDVSFNDFTSAPELSAIPRIDTLFVHNNHFPFAVLEGCLPSGSSAERVRFRYAPQDLIAPRLQDTTALVDAPFALTVSASGANNRYLWRKNGVVIQEQSTLATLIIPVFALQDTGRYSCEITNALLPEIRLTTASVRVGGVLPPLPAAPLELFAPRVGELDVSLTPLFAWASVMGAGRYRLQVAESSDFSTLRLDTVISQAASNLALGRVEFQTRRPSGSNTPTGFPLPQDTRLFWRVRAENASGGGVWKEGIFTTLPPDALISVQAVDFGTTPRRDSVWKDLVVRNLSTSPIHLAARTASDNAAFRIGDTLRTSTGSTITTGGTATITSGSEIVLRTLFAPQTLGRFAGGVSMRFRVGASAVEQVQSFAARLIGRAGAVKLVAPNFGTVVVGKKRIASALLINVGDKPLTLQSMVLRQKTDAYRFRFEERERLVQPNDTLTLPMSVLADSAGIVRPDTVRCITIVGESQQFSREDIDTTQIPLSTIARLPEANDVFVRVGIRAVENNLPPGSSIRLEVYIAETRGLDSIFRAALPTIRGTIRLNENVLALDRSETGARRMNGTSRNQDGFQSYSIPLNNWSGRGAVLLPIRCIALAGSTDATALVLEEIEWGAGNVIVDSLIDGAFRAKISQAGGRRLIAPTTTTQGIVIAGIAPNPVKEAIDVHYTLSEGGLVEVALLDVRGNVAQLLTQEVQSAGEHTLNAKIGWLASGSYTLRISVHGESETRLIRVVR